MSFKKDLQELIKPLITLEEKCSEYLNLYIGYNVEEEVKTTSLLLIKDIERELHNLRINLELKNESNNS